MRKIILALALLLAPVSVLAQSVQQSGSVTPNHASCWTTNGVIQDCGTAADSPLSTLGITNNGGTGLCISTGRVTAAGRQQLCFSASLNGAGIISLQNYGTATPQSLEFLINGIAIVIPTGGGGTIPSITIPQVTGNLICASGTTGALTGCTTGTNGQLLVGQTGAIPQWLTVNGDISSVSAAGNFTVGKVNGVTYPASPSVGTAAYVSGTNAITYGQIPITAGGTGVATLAAHGSLIGNGTNAITSLTTAQIGYCLLSQGASSDPIWAACASGTGTAGGANTQVQFNNSSNLAGNANLTWVSPALTIGQNATTTGQLILANGGALGTSVTIQNPSDTTPYNFNLPPTSGTLGQPLISGGGGSTAMSFGTLGIGGGGTNCSAASGTCLDNITNFSSTGYLNRTGVGTYAFSTLIPLSGGGTNANLTASNGGIFYSSASAGAILAGTATARQMLQSGASTTPAWSTATWPATTTANQILYSSSTNTVGEIATAASSVLITSAGSVPSLSQTLPSAVQGNITATGTIATGVWNGTAIDLAHGGTNANLTASNGGIFYSSASAGAILAGTATANQPLLSGSSTTPAWATISYPTSAISGGIPYFSSTTATASSALLTNHAIVLGGGAGAAPTVLGSLGTSTTLLHGAAAGAPTFGSLVDADITANTISNASLAQMAAVTLKGNPTNALANASDFTLAGLTARGAPDASNDLLLLWDSAAGTLKKVTPGQVASSATAGVASLNALTGALSISVVQQKFTASGTYTPTTGMVYAIIQCVGPGGGGGGSGGATAGLGIAIGGGGGAGSYSRLVASAATVGASKTVTVGTGGTGGSGAGNGNNGSAATSVGTICTANPGSGGSGAAANSNAAGGAGGTAGTGNISVGNAGQGGPGGSANTFALYGGAGASSIFGGSNGTSAFNATGLAATGCGAGGSGASAYANAAGQAGGGGFDGCVLITELVVH